MITISDYIKKISIFAGLSEDELDVNLEEGDDRVSVQLQIEDSDTAKRLIGIEGANLKALQTLLRKTFSYEKDKKISLDINQYKQNQEKELIDEIEDAAHEVLETGQPKTFYDLNSYERYLAHTTVAENKEFEELSSYSTTVGSDRYLTICLQEDSPESS